MTNSTDKANNQTKEASNSLNPNDWLRQLVINLPQGILLTDKDRKIIYTNEQLLELFGVTMDTELLVGKPADLLLSNMGLSNTEKHKQRVAELIAGKQPVFKDFISLANGRVILRDYIPVKKK